MTFDLEMLPRFLKRVKKQSPDNNIIFKIFLIITLLKNDLEKVKYNFFYNLQETHPFFIPVIL